MNTDFIETDRGTILSNGCEYFPASVLSKLLEMSRAGVYKAAARGDWPVIKAPGRGAKNGVQYFLVPDKILREINEILDGGKKAVASDNHSSGKTTVLTLKSNEYHPNGDTIDPLLMHHVMVAVDTMLTKNDMVINPAKKADLVFLIHDCCKATGVVTEEIVGRFIKLTG